MTDLQIFKNEEFGEIRTVTIDNEIWFVGKDVAEALGYTNPQKAIRDHVDEEDKTVNESFSVNGTKGILINESGLYSLVLSSKLSTAKKFKRWVTSEVLPTIRKTGSYQAPMSLDEQIKLVAKGYVDMNKRITATETKLDEVKIEIDDFKASMTMTPGECDELQKSVKKRVVELLGGKDTEAYMDKSLRTKVFTNCWNRLKDEFGVVGSYKHIKSKNFDIAKSFIEGYVLTFALQEEVDDANAQMRLEG